MNNVRYMYTTNSVGRRVTIGYVYDDANNQIRVATAQCSVRDRFVKEYGRAAVVGRLNKYGGTAIPFSTIGGSSYKQVAAYISSNIETFAPSNREVSPESKLLTNDVKPALMIGNT